MILNELIKETQKNQMISTLFKHYKVESVKMKYKSIKDIMLEYFDVRLKLYHDRKKYQLEILKHTLDLISYKVKFNNDKTYNE